ncbi:hypothetical protein [Crocosphaera sp.]|uniref:hypothetical protein n=1 Tax=Crocosphaera sp. TaxID=2729996 RepID=UPI003F2021E2|nr:hypothetical protein [Crocosphaera sp.]
MVSTITDLNPRLVFHQGSEEGGEKAIAPISLSGAKIVLNPKIFGEEVGKIV